jgi:hypothetical protein
LALQNGNQERQAQAVIETATGSGKRKSEREASFPNFPIGISCVSLSGGQTFDFIPHTIVIDCPLKYSFVSVSYVQIAGL